MEHTDDAPLVDDGQRSAIPDDQPLDGAVGPGDENMPSRPVTSGPGEDGPREPSPEEDRPPS